MIEKACKIRGEDLSSFTRRALKKELAILGLYNKDELNLRSLVNVLIEWVDLQVYTAKEAAIEDLLPFLLKFIEDMYPNEKDLK